MAQKGTYTYDYPRPMVTVDALVFCLDKENTSLLLIKRGAEPFKGQWAFPGGFVEMDEELEHAVARELAEETGLKNVCLTQYRTIGTIGRDPRGRQITVVYWATTDPTNAKVVGGDDAEHAKWFSIEDLPSMAFDHAAIAAAAINDLKILNQ